MIKFEQLSSDTQLKVRKDALDWYKAHQTQVMKLIHNDTNRFAPVGNDLMSPQTWSAGNWRWFLENSFLL